MLVTDVVEKSFEKRKVGKFEMKFETTKFEGSKLKITSDVGKNY